MTDISKTNAVFCPKDWNKFRSSCYKSYLNKETWEAALAYCQQERGASLVSFDDKVEEEYVKNTMKSKGVDVFHMATQNSASFFKYAFMCEYKLGKIRQITSVLYCEIINNL